MIYRSTKNALAMLLMKLRLQSACITTNNCLSFRHQQPLIVSDCIRDVLKALKDGLVPHHLGYHRFTRESLLSNHMSSYFTKVLDIPDDSIVTILDGTYLYVEVTIA